MRNLLALNFQIKSNLQRTRDITPMRATRDEDHFRGLSSEQHSSGGKSQRWRAVDDTTSALTGKEIEPETYRTDSNVFNSCAKRPVDFNFAASNSVESS